MSESFNSNWFPGHMAKSIKQIQQIAKFVDFWFEVVDSRAPLSTRSSLFEHIKSNKPIVIILAKSDLANDSITNSWRIYFEKNNIFGIKSTKNNNIKKMISVAVKNLRLKKNFQTYRSAVIGVPNVGKSYFINKILGNKKLKVENRAGVTKRLNWISCGNFEICDTPGILPTKLEERFAKKISYLGLIKSNIFDPEEIALNLISELYPNENPNDFLARFAQSKGCISLGNNIDIQRASDLFLKKFRNGDFGKISLESPIM